MESKSVGVSSAVRTVRAELLRQMCGIALHNGPWASGLQGSIHYVSINVTGRGMQKCFGKTSDDFEAEALPELDGPFVSANHKVELHGAVSSIFCVIERVRAHCSGYSFSRRGCGCYVSTVCDVGAAAALVGADVVCSDNLSVVFGYEDLMAGRDPIGEGFFAAHIVRQSIGVSGADDWFKDCPDCIGVVGPRGSNVQHGFMLT